MAGAQNSPGAERKQRDHDRAELRAKLQPGDEFRSYNLFDEYGVVPASLMDEPGISPGGKLTWCCVGRRLGKSGIACPSLKTLGRDLGVSRRQVSRWIAELERLGLLRSITRSAGPGDHDSNEYRLLWQPFLNQGSG